MMEAAIRRTFGDAIRGGARAQELILRQMAMISQADEALEIEFTKTMIDAKVYGEEELSGVRGVALRMSRSWSHTRTISILISRQVL